MSLTVAPETFAVSPLMPTSVSPDTAYRAVSAGLEMGRPQRAPQAAGIDFSTVRQTSTLDSLLRLGSAALEPKVKQSRMRQMGEGAIAAIQGVTAKELAEGDMLNGVFGDPTAVAAARQVEKITQLDKSLQEVQDNMDTWRTKSPDEFRKALPGIMEKHLTGDELSDSLISRAFIEKIPALTDLHTRAHVSYVNQRAEDAVFDSVNTSADILTRYMRAGEAGEVRDTSAVEAAFLRDVAGNLSGFKPEHIEKASMALVHSLAAKGQYEVLSLLESAGLAKGFSKEAQAAMPKAVHEAQREDWLNNPRHLVARQSIGTFEAAVREGLITSEADIIQMYRQHGEGLTPTWVQNQTEQMHVALAALARRTKEMNPKDSARFAYATTVSRGGDLQGYDPVLKSPREVRTQIDLDYADNPQRAVANAIKGNGWLPTPVAATGSAAVNHVMAGTLMPGSDTQPGDLPVLRQLAELDAQRPEVVARSMDEKTYANFKAMQALGVLRDLGSHEKNQQNIASISTILREGNSKIADPAWVRERDKEARAAAGNKPWIFSDEENGESSLSALGRRTTNWWAGAKNLTSDQRADYEFMRASRVARVATSTNMPMPAIIKMVDAAMRDEIDTFNGWPVMNAAGRTRPFKTAVAAAMGAGHAALDDVKLELVQQQVFENAISLGTRKELNRETDYTIMAVAYEGDGLRVSYTFPGEGSQQAFITPGAVAAEWKKVKPQGPTLLEGMLDSYIQ